MAQEIERKFLVRDARFKDEAFCSLHIEQGYLNSAPERTVRVRTKGDRGYVTVKGPGGAGGVSRFEWEKEIPLEDALALLELCEPGAVDKTRYLVRDTDGIHIWEVDEFHGDNEGLVVAEVELSSEDEVFDRPSWLGEEVTGDSKYCNSMLSRHPYGKWSI